MKHLILFSSAALLSITLVTEPVQSQVYVKIRPSPPVVVAVRSTPPRPAYVWIEPEWRWQRGSYVYVEGRWVKPRHRRIWIPGHWDEGTMGYRWTPGHWARR